MAEIKLRLNLDARDVEIIVNDKVVDTVGKDVVDSWVQALKPTPEPQDEPEPASEEPAAAE